jgi:pyruvate dehydrogenase E1 component alpha subunit
MATETAKSAVPADVSEHLTTEDRVGLLRAMLMMRGIEERAMTLYRQGKVPGSFYDGFGQEAVSAGAAWAMAAQDRLCILHRDLAAHVIRGVEPARIFSRACAGGSLRRRPGREALHPRPQPEGLRLPILAEPRGVLPHGRAVAPGGAGPR